jgi:prepilin-type N-terminal cleavage/methylation domain-containing protein
MWEPVSRSSKVSLIGPHGGAPPVLSWSGIAGRESRSFRVRAATTLVHTPKQRRAASTAGVPALQTCGAALMRDKSGTGFSEVLDFPMMKVSANQRRAFTLVELMAVVLVILLIAGLTLGVVTYVGTRMKVARAKAELATLEAAIENFKSDHGYYPTSSIYRLSYQVYLVKINSGLLYQQLTKGGGKYVNFKADQLAYDSLSGMTNLVDPWGSPVVYYSYNTNVTVASMIASNWFGSFNNATFDNWVTIGGKKNPATFDLFSYGPDKMTFIPYNHVSNTWYNSSYAIDDIWSGQ